ncbi:MAG: methionine--tRNA ligase [Candidatus Margulisiibacteriota bacterium]
MTKTLLVTSALPYANGDIHLGHLVEHVQTDIFVRFQKLIGNQCYYMCADDTHGTAVMLSAEKEGLSPEVFVDKVQQQHMSDFKLFHIDYDDYYTTHSPENELISQSVYLAAEADGGIETRDIEQYYCESSGLFLADRYIKGTCPKCDALDQYGDACEQCYTTYCATELKDPVSVFSGQAPVLKSSKHYFFKLDRYKKTIEQWLATNPVSQPVKNKLNEWFEQGLKDWDISRDAPYFGFKIPNTENKYFYVWMDAPIGYIATTDHWAKKQGKAAADFWKNDAVEIHHFIGKDIMYFHTLFWPAMLSVAGYNVPKKVNVHGFLTINGEKMSKSRGTFILARDYADHLDPDILRYYYAAKLSSSMDDIDFNAVDFVNKVNSDVLGKFINIASRIGSIVTKKLAGKLSFIDDDGHHILTQMLRAKEQIITHYNDLETHKCMRKIMECADLMNKYIDEKAPWALVKDDPNQAQVVCTTALNGLRILMIYLSPVMPKIVEKLASFLNIEVQSWESLSMHLLDTDIAPYEHILKRLTVDDLAAIFGATES